MNSKVLFESLEARQLLSAAGGGGWYGVDDYQLAAGQQAISNAIATDASGDVFAAGDVKDAAGVSHAVVREKPAGSSTWFTVLDFQLTGGKAAAFDGATVASDGTLYMGGYASDGSGINHWVVLRSAGTDYSHYSVIDNFQAQPGLAATAIGFTADSAGDVFVAGYANGPVSKRQNASHWTVRELATGATAFHTVDSFVTADGAGAQANGIGVVPAGPSAGIYVTGRAGAQSNWTTRKSVDGGATWSTVDSYNYDGGVHGSYGAGVVADAQGNLFVSGVGAAYNGVTKTSGSNHLLVRKSVDGGAHWTLVDDWRYAAGSGNGEASWGAIGRDGNGNVTVAGDGKDQGGVYHAVVRSLVNNVWTVVDDVPSAINRSFGTDANGYSYAGGMDETNKHWIMRDPPPGTLLPTIGNASGHRRQRHHHHPLKDLASIA